MWKAAAQTEAGAALLEGAAAPRTLAYLDAMTRLGAGQPNQLQLRSIALIERPDQLAAHRAFVALGAVDGSGAEPIATQVDDILVRHEPSSYLRNPASLKPGGEWDPRSHLIYVRGEIDGPSALLHHLRNGSEGPINAELAEELGISLHEGTHALSGITPASLTGAAEQMWLEEGGTQLLTAIPARFSAFARAATGLELPAQGSDAASAHARQLAFVYFDEQVHTRHLLAYAGIDMAGGGADAATAAQRVLQGGPHHERLDRITAAIAAAHPNADAAEIRSNVEVDTSELVTGSITGRKADAHSHAFDYLDSQLVGDGGPAPVAHLEDIRDQWLSGDRYTVSEIQDVQREWPGSSVVG